MYVNLSISFDRELLELYYNFLLKINNKLLFSKNISKFIILLRFFEIQISHTKYLWCSQYY